MGGGCERTRPSHRVYILVLGIKWDIHTVGEDCACGLDLGCGNVLLRACVRAGSYDWSRRSGDYPVCIVDIARFFTVALNWVCRIGTTREKNTITQYRARDSTEQGRGVLTAWLDNAPYYLLAPSCPVYEPGTSSYFQCSVVKKQPR